jgi:hypothetical protein
MTDFIIAGALTITVSSNDKKAKYVDQDGELILPKAGLFTLSINEFDNAKEKYKAAFEKQEEALMKQFNAHIKNVSNQAAELKAAASIANVNAANMTAYKKKDAAYQASLKAHADKKTKYDAAINKLKNEYSDNVKKLEKAFENVRFVRMLAPNANMGLTKDSYNKTMGNGYKGPVNLEFNTFLEGGGKIYIEAFFANEQPKGNKNFGKFISATGTPKIIGTRWSDYAGNPVSKRVAFQSHLLLHVYTTGLYGQDLEMQMWDKDWGSYDANDPLTTKSDAGPTYKVCEVNVYEPNEALESDLNIQKGVLSNIDKKDQPGKVYVQKAVLEVFVDSTWGKEGGSLLWLYGAVKASSIKIGERKFTDKDYVEIVSRGGIQFPKTPNNGNMPAKVGMVETSMAKYRMCHYTKISGKAYKGEETIQDVVFFDEAQIGDAALDVLNFPVVAGVKEALGKLEITLDPKTKDCINDGTKSDHEGNVIDVSRIIHLLKAGKGEAKGFRLWDTERIVKNNNLTNNSIKSSKKTLDSDDQNDGQIQDISHSSSSGKANLGFLKIKGQSSYRILESYKPFVLNSPSDGQLKLEIAYDFNRNRVDPLEGLMKTIWPNNKHVAQLLLLSFNTCRYVKPLNIIVYPDTKWTLQIAFNYDAGRFAQVQGAYHDKWKLEQLSAESTIRRLKGEKRGNPSARSARIREQKAIVQQAKKNSGKLARGSNAAKLLMPSNASKAGIIDCEVGLICEFDRPFEALEVSTAFSQLKEFFRKIANIKEKIDDITNGVDEQATKKSPKENKKRMDKLKAKLEDLKRKGKDNSAWSFEFIPPSLGISLSWYAEHPKDINKPVMGTMIEGVIKAEPLMGFEVKYDIFQLLSKIPHPVVKGVVLVLEVLDYALGDNFDINLDFVVSGELGITGQGTINTVSGSSFMQRLKKDEDDSPFKVSGTLKMSIKAEVFASGTVNNFLFGEHGIYGRVEGSVTTGITCEGVTKASDDDGLYIEPEIKFHGIVLKGSFAIGIIDPPSSQGGKKGRPEDQEGIHYSKKGEIVVMDAYEWELKDWRIYIAKNERK